METSPKAVPEPQPHTIRVLGPYSPEQSARPDAAKLAKIQTEAWLGWLARQGVSRKVIEQTLASNDLDARETSLREALQRDNQNRAVLYLGAFNTDGEQVGFSKWRISAEELNEPLPDEATSRMVFDLNEIDVLPEYQGTQADGEDNQNLARKMMYSVLTGVQDPNAVIRLDVLGGNTRARAFYRHLQLRIIDDSQMFVFEDAEGKPVHQQNYLKMEGSAITALNILKEDLGIA